MAPRRNSNNNGNGSSNPTQQQQQPPSSQQQQQQQHQSVAAHLLNFYAEAGNGINNGMSPMQTRCCLPSGDCGKLEPLIPLDESGLADCVRVLCNNENCNVGQYMHRECFEAWEAAVLQTLKGSGRARNWTSQHLWAKKGYELVHKACGCKCGRGHLRKDLEWAAPTAGHLKKATMFHNGRALNNGNGNGNLSEDDDKKKAKKKRNRNNNNNNNGGGQQKNALALTPLNTNNASNGYQPNPNVGVIGSGLPHNNNSSNNSGNNGSNLGNILINGHHNNNSANNVLGLDLRARAGSLSSSGSSSPSASQSSADISISPVQQQQQQQQPLAAANAAALLMQPPPTSYAGSLMLQNGLGLSKSILSAVAAQSQSQSQSSSTLPALANISNFKPLASFDQQQLVQQQKNKEVELYSERVRSTSGCNGIFSRRLDFSSFNLLPKTRLNSYQVKIEDEGNHGNDETRLFILSSLAQSQMSRVACILCEEPLLVFDRYPLVDGSFFLSPKQHSSGCIEVKYEGRALYLTSVCMSCLDGTSSSRLISCRFCNEPWDGSNLVLGTMYAYDIFAAMPCCAERFKCNTCFKMLMYPQQRLSFYSDYSHGVTCPYCNTQDTHFVKPLSYCYSKSNGARPQPLA